VDDLDEWEEAASTTAPVHEPLAKSTKQTRVERQLENVCGEISRNHPTHIFQQESAWKTKQTEEKSAAEEKKRARAEEKARNKRRGRRDSTSSEEEATVEDKPVKPMTTVEVQEEMHQEYGLKLKKNFIDSIDADRAIMVRCFDLRDLNKFCRK